MELSSNVLVLAGVFAAGTLLGYFLRRRNTLSYDKKITELEKEMLNSHAEILQLQREKIEMLRKLESPSIPVIPIKSPSKEEKTSEPLPDVTHRKKLLTNP